MRDPQSSACGTLWACIFAIALAFWVALQAHVNYTFDSGMWIGLDSAWFSGGQTRVNDIALPDRQNNMRLGATLSLPMSREQTLKFVYSTGLATRRGADFDTFVILWQFVRS